MLEPLATTIVGLVEASGPEVLLMADPNCRPAAIADPAAYRSRLDRLLSRVDVVKVSTDDLAWLEPARDPLAASRVLLDRGPAVVLLTDGGGPVRIITSRETVSVAVPSVPVVDTIGAGDSFGAGFLAAWTTAGRGRGDLADLAAVTRAVQFAVAVGAWTAGRAGADPPTRTEMADRFPDWERLVNST